MEWFETLKQYLPLLVPIFIIQVTLMVVALLDLSKRARTKGPKWMWAIIIIFVNLIGPIVYFTVGREDE